jgi:hypothetical protein
MPTYVETPITFGGQSVPAIFPDWANGQAVAYTGTAAQSAAITATMVMVTSDTKCWITSSANPTATAGAGSYPIDPGITLVIGVRSGDKISAIRDTASGTLVIMPALSV